MPHIVSFRRVISIPIRILHRGDKSKIADFDLRRVAIRIKEDIARLQVPMYQLHGMYICNRLQYLLIDGVYLYARSVTITLHPVFKRHLITELHLNKEVTPLLFRLLRIASITFTSNKV